MINFDLFVTPPEIDAFLLLLNSAAFHAHCNCTPSPRLVAMPPAPGSSEPDAGEPGLKRMCIQTKDRADAAETETTAVAADPVIVADLSALALPSPPLDDANEPWRTVADTSVTYAALRSLELELELEQAPRPPQQPSGRPGQGGVELWMARDWRGCLDQRLDDNYFLVPVPVEGSSRL